MSFDPDRIPEMTPAEAARFILERRYRALNSTYDVLVANARYPAAWSTLCQILETARELGMSEDTIARLARRDGLGERLGHLPPQNDSAPKGRKPAHTPRSR